MRWVRVLAVSLMAGGLWRSWGAGRHPLHQLDDMLMGGFLLAAAYATALVGTWASIALPERGHG